MLTFSARATSFTGHCLRTWRSKIWNCLGLICRLTRANAAADKFVSHFVPKRFPNQNRPDRESFQSLPCEPFHPGPPARPALAGRRFFNCLSIRRRVTSISQLLNDPFTGS